MRAKREGSVTEWAHLINGPNGLPQLGLSLGSAWAQFTKWSRIVLAETGSWQTVAKTTRPNTNLHDLPCIVINRRLII